MAKDGRLRTTSGYKRFWTPKRIDELCSIVGEYGKITEAVDAVSAHFNYTVTANSIRMVLRENGIAPSSVLKAPNRSIRQVFWTDDKVIKILESLSAAKSIDEALKHLSDNLETHITYDMARGVLARNHISSKLSSLVGKCAKEELRKFKIQLNKRTEWEKKTKAKDAKVTRGKMVEKVEKVDKKTSLEEDIIEYILKFSKSQSRKSMKKRSTLTLTTLCNLFDCSPHRLESALVKAKANGYRVELSDENIKINTTLINNESIVGPRPKIKMPKLSKDKITFAVISDTHFGSAHCLKDEIADFVNMAYSEFDIRLILHSGDILAGNNVYKGQKFELEAWGCRDQCKICTETLPQKKDLKYVYILGNHDVDFMKTNGTNPADLIDAWRSDMTCIGNIAARFILDPYDIDIELSHIRSSAHARSWSLEKHLQKTISKHNAPDVLFCGHKHTNGYFMPQNVHSCLVPCFETMNIYATYGDFYPTIGGIIVTMTLDKEGRINRFTPLFHNYPIEFQTTINSSEIV